MVAVASKKVHSVNGRQYGWWSTLDTGDLIYVGYRKSTADRRGFSRMHDAWLIDLRVLREAQAKGVTSICLVHGNKRRTYYATLIEDFFGPLSSSHTGKDGLQRALPRKAWRVNPGLKMESIARSMQIGK